MKLHTLKSTPNSRKDRYRAARGMAQGRGKQAGKGQSGQNKRGGVRPGFEGGQNLWYRRLPKVGFNNVNHTTYQIVSLADLEKAFESGAKVDRESLSLHGLINRKLPIKLLANGKLTKKLIIQVEAVSAAAKVAVEKTGGKVVTFAE